MMSYLCLLAVLFGAPQASAQVRPAGYRIETLAGSQAVGDGKPATAAQLSKIQGVTVDRLGNLYLSDTDHHRVRKVAPSGLITTVAGTGMAGYSGDGGPASQAQLNLPYGLAADAIGNLYIADLGNNRIRRVWPDGVITTLIPDTALATPRNLALDAAGNLYVSEFDGHRVRRIASDGRVTTAAGTGKAGFAGDGGAPEQAQLAYPCGIAFDRGGALLIADSGNNRVRRIFSNGTINTILGGSSGTALATPVAVAVDQQIAIYVGDAAPVVRSLTLAGKWSDVAGGALPGFSGDGGAARSAMLTSVRDLAADGSGNLYIADGARVRRVDTAGNIATVAGDGYLHSVGDGGPALDALLSRPSAVTLDGAGNLSIADTGTGRARQVASGVMGTLAGGLNQPMGVAADASGTVYVADTGAGQIRAIGTDHLVRTLPGTVAAPRGLCLSREGALHVVDTTSGRVLRMVWPQVTVAGQLSAPEACAFDSFGNLYVAETGAHRIRKLSPAGEWSVMAGAGTAGSDGDEGPATAAHLSFPRGLAVDDGGNLYIADTGGNRIRLVTPDGTIHTIAGTGVAGFSGDGGDALAAQLNGPAGLFLDGAGAVYVADSLNDRVRRLTAATSPAVADVVAPVAVVNALSGTGGGVAPGELVRVTGSGFGGDIASEVWFGARSVPIVASAAGQVSVQAPEELAGMATTHVEVRVGGKVAGAADVGVAEAAPGVLPLTVNQDGSLNMAMRPAAPGDLLGVLATGLGRLEYGLPVLPVAVTIDGAGAEVVNIQADTGTAGVLLVVVRVPGGFVSSGEVPLVLTVGGVAAPAVPVWLR